MKKKRFKIDKMPTREPDFRIRYNRWFKPPYTLIVWDVKNKKEYCTNHFDFDNCVIQMKYKNSITSIIPVLISISCLYVFYIRLMTLIIFLKK